MEPSGQAAVRWITREELSPAFGLGHARGLLVGPVLGQAVPMSSADVAAAHALTQKGLRAGGLEPDDRVVVCLNNDGDLAGVRFATAAAEISASACALGPRGRMRLFQAIEAVRATALVTTPTGAMDFLARLHLEFLLDPLDLGLRTLVLTGEIADPATYRHLASEFGAEVVAVYSDPACGMPLGTWRPAGTEHFMTLVEREILGLAKIDKDQLVDGDHEGLAEIVVGHRWHSQLGAFVVRTGHVVNFDGSGIPLPDHTVGHQILVRGVWLPLRLLERALSKIDGIAWWELAIERKGTLDQAALHVTFTRESLVGNPMWKGRLEEALTSVTPIHIEVVVGEEIGEGSRPFIVSDHRGHHLGVDRQHL